jgi:hypothetical protein
MARVQCLIYVHQDPRKLRAVRGLLNPAARGRASSGSFQLNSHFFLFVSIVCSDDGPEGTDRAVC